MPPPPNVVELAWVLPVAVGFSSVAIAAGISGPLFFSPFFMLALGLPPAQAVGAGLLTAVFGMGNGLRAYARQGVVDVRSALALAAGAIPATVLGAHLAHHVPALALRLGFGGGLAILGTHLLLARRREAPTTGAPRWPTRPMMTRDGVRLEVPLRPLAPRVLLGAAGGAVTGMMSAGLPELATSEQILRGRVPPRVAVATSTFAMALVALAGAATHATEAALPWHVVAWTIPGALIGSTLGSRVGRHLPPRLLARALGWLFLIVGLAVATLAPA